MALVRPFYKVGLASGQFVSTVEMDPSIDTETKAFVLGTYYIMNLIVAPSLQLIDDVSLA
jgi:hypothetical protein